MTGDPAAPAGEPQSAGLGPRQSFDTWVQEVWGHGRPWLPAEIDAGRALARAIPELQLARARDELARLALHDPLTGLPNRALLLACTAQALARQKQGAKRVALLFIDLDHFKSVNELYGHAGGDEILCQAAERLGVAVSHSDTVARAGDDEFLVLCEATTPDEVGRLSNRIVQAFRTPFLVGGQEAQVTTSIGVAVAVAKSDATPAELLRHADTAMNRAKRSGRNIAMP
jgi:diguanylate cyclase (GGDEF)-like protein